MLKFEKIVYTLILGFIPPVFLFVTLWFTLYALFPERNLYFFSIFGFMAGLVIDVVFMKRWLASIYQWPIGLLIVIFSFFHIGMIGFFMGFPVFNSLLGILAGYYFGCRIKKSVSTEEKKKKLAFKVSISTALAMFLICIFSGSVALTDPYTSSSLRGILGLNFEPSREMLIGLVILGGTSLVVFEYLITRFLIKKGTN